MHSSEGDLADYDTENDLAVSVPEFKVNLILHI